MPSTVSEIVMLSIQRCPMCAVWQMLSGCSTVIAKTKTRTMRPSCVVVVAEVARRLRRGEPEILGEDAFHAAGEGFLRADESGGQLPS